MLKPLLSIIAVSGIGLFLTGARVSPQTEAAQGIPGYYNPTSHTFQAKVVPQVQPNVVTKPYDGKFVLNTPSSSRRRSPPGKIYTAAQLPDSKIRIRIMFIRKPLLLSRK